MAPICKLLIKEYVRGDCIMTERIKQIVSMIIFYKKVDDIRACALERIPSTSLFDLLP